MTAIGIAVGMAAIFAAYLEIKNLIQGKCTGQDFYILIVSFGGTAWFAARLMGWQ